MPITSILSQIKDKTEIGHLSHSQINMLLRCPQQYSFRYISGIKIPPAGALIQGDAYHKGLKEGFTIKKNTKEDPKKNIILEAASQGWDDRIKAEGEIDWEDENPGQLKDTMIGVLSKYVGDVMPQIVPIEIEQREELEVGGIPFIRIRDLVVPDGVIDHKLAAGRYNENQIYSDLQSLAYVYPDGGKFWYHVGVKGRSNMKVKKYDIQIVNFTRTKDDVDWWVNLVKKCYDQIKAGIFPPNPTGYYCNPTWCGYFKLCRNKK